MIGKLIKDLLISTLIISIIVTIFFSLYPFIRHFFDILGNEFFNKTYVEFVNTPTKGNDTTLKILDKFYRDRKVEAWTPIQFRVGPYYCVKKENKIVSVAGVHLVTPQIAQLGNIITDQAYRRQGFASVCTSTLAVDLASKKRIISLFVRTDNRSAINMYRNLGFYKIMDRAFLVMRKDA